MPNTIAIAASLGLTRSSTSLTSGVGTVAANQVDTDGKFGGGSIKCANAAASIPVGNCTASSGSAYIWVFLRNLDAAQDAKVEDASAHLIGYVRAGKTWGPCLVDFVPKVKADVTDETPTIWATVVQE